MTLAAKPEDIRLMARKEGVEKGRVQGLAEGLEQGTERGTYNTKIGMVKRLFARNLPLEDIADICNLDLSEIKKILEDG